MLRIISSRDTTIEERRARRVDRESLNALAPDIDMEVAAATFVVFGEHDFNLDYLRGLDMTAASDAELDLDGDDDDNDG